MDVGLLVGPRGAARRNYVGDYNAAAPLTTPTYDGSGQTVHPDVVDLGAGGAWHGYRYWMAVTPYPAGNDAYENPSILASNDGTTWAVPAGVANPIVAAPADYVQFSKHNADPDLTLDGADVMHLVYVHVDGATSRVKHTSSGDGWATHSAVVELFSSSTVTILAPAVVFDGSGWSMWVVDAATSPNRYLRYTAPAITGPWTGPTVCPVSGVPAGRELWHVDVILDPSDGTLHALATLTDLNGNGVNTRNHLARSADGLDWTVGDVVLPIATGGFDNSLSYRGTIVLGGGVYECWYSGQSGTAWRVGRTTIPRLAAPALP